MTALFGAGGLALTALGVLDTAVLESIRLREDEVIQ